MPSQSKYRPHDVLTREDIKQLLRLAQEKVSTQEDVSTQELPERPQAAGTTSRPAYSTKELAEGFGVTQRTVQYHLQNAGIARPKNGEARKHSPEFMRELLRLARTRKPTEEIAEHFGVTPRRITQLLNDCGHPRPRHAGTSLTEEERGRIVRLHQAKEKKAAIARATMRDPKTVRRVLQEEGLLN